MHAVKALQTCDDVGVNPSEMTTTGRAPLPTGAGSPTVMGNDEIAEHLFLSTKTVRNHITHVFTKAGVTTRAQAIARARDAGFAREPLALAPRTKTD